MLILRPFSLIRPVIGVALAMMCSVSAVAQNRDGFFSDMVDFADALIPEGTRFTVGLGPRLGPDYFGSDEYEVEPDLVFLVRLGDVLTLSNDGAELNILGLKDFQFGPVVRTTGGRSESSNAALEGLGRIRRSLDLGVYARVNVNDYFTARLRYYHAVIRSGNGGVFDLTLSRLLYRKDNLSVALGVRGSWAQSNRAGQFFGISPEQSLDSGLPEYSPGASFQDIRVNLGARWEFSDQWALNGFVRYSRLLDDIADSPIVDPLGSPNQFTIGSSVTYNFSLD